jgi:deoxyribodipyrimidine photo-lyase
MLDNPALFHGSKNQDYGVIYLYDQNYWQANGKSEIQFNFLLDCLKVFDLKLKEKNSQINVFSGNYLGLQKWIETHFSESTIHANHCTDVGYFRDDFNGFRNYFLKKEKLKLYSDFGVQVKAPNRDKWASDWEDQMSKPLLKEPYANQSIKKIDKPLKPLNLFLKDLKLVKKNYSFFQSGGSDNANALLNSFLKERSAGYSFKMSSPHEAEHSCSRLSPHIAFGSVSIREIYQRTS